MKFPKNILLFVILCAGLQQSCNAMDAEQVDLQKYHLIKCQIRDLIVGTNHRCDGSVDDFKEQFETLFAALQKNKSHQKRNFLLPDLVYEDGENILTLFAKTCCGKLCSNCFLRLSCIFDRLEGIGIDYPEYFLDEGDVLVYLTALLNASNVDSQTFLSIVLERKLFLILFDLMVTRRTRKKDISFYNKSILVKSNNIFFDFLSPEFIDGLNSMLEPDREINYKSGMHFHREEFMDFVSKIFDFVFRLGLVGYNDLGKKLLSYARESLRTLCDKDKKSLFEEYETCGSIVALEYYALYIGLARTKEPQFWSDLKGKLVKRIGEQSVQQKSFALFSEGDTAKTDFCDVEVVISD